jgi:hypothetical protein
VVKKRTTLDDKDRRGPLSGAGKHSVEQPPPSVVSLYMQPSPGIDVQEDELGVVTAQQVYRMRCECGRSWFELELRRLAQCPACHRLGLVSGGK